MSRRSLYHLLNGLWTGIPLCCIRFWLHGNTGSTRKQPDPLVGTAQYVRCDECVKHKRISKIRCNGSICHWLITKGGPWYAPSYTDDVINLYPIMLANERQSAFFAENPRDEEITRKVGWDERYELMLEQLEESQ